MATPTSSNAVRRPSAATTTIITSNTAEMTLFCRSVGMLRICSDRSWVKVACVAGPTALNLSDHHLHLVDRVDDIGAGALLHFQSNGRLAIQTRHVLNVLEGPTDGRDVG